MNNLAPFQLLELNVISAQDLEPICRRKMRTYAVAWVHSERKLSTRIDTQGHNNPTWNDKFIFRVDDEFLYGDTSAVMIEIYAVHWFRDIHVGTVRAIIGNLLPPISRPNRRQEVQLGMRFVALQVWRPSGRPQGILNIGVALLDSSMRSMPLYLQMGSSAVGYRHLMGEEDPFQGSNNNPLSSTTKSNNDNHQLLLNALIKPELRRTKSDSSSIFEPDLKPRKSMKGSSIINGGSVVYGGGSMVNGSEIEKNNCKVNSRGSSMVNYTFAKSNAKKGKASSIVNGSEDPGKNNYKVNSRGSSMVNYTFGKTDAKKGKASSIVNGSEDPGKNNCKVNSRGSSMVNYKFGKSNAKKGKSSSIVNGSEDPGKKGLENGVNGPKIGLKTPPGKSPSGLRYSGLDYGAQKKPGGGKIWTDSELGPSPSEVAAAVAKNMHLNRCDEAESSLVGGWSLDDQSIEGLRSKLERWRTELPPVYDRSNEISSFVSTGIPTTSKRTKHVRRHTDNGGSFSCFGNICGCEISITCGGGPPATRKKGNLHRTPSSVADDLSYL